MAPDGSKKDDFLRLKSQLDTLLQIDGTKRVGNSFSLKLNDSFNVNIDEVLKSLGMKGGLEHEDASSMIEDEAEEEVEDDKKEQAPEMAQPGQPGDPQQQMPQMEGIIRKGVYYFLFEQDMFQPGPKKTKHRGTKRYGEYWKPLERVKGKNRNALTPEDILEIRKEYSRKPASNDRDLVLKSLDKAVNYFHKKLTKVKGEDEAERFYQKYISIDNLRPSDYGSDEEMDTPAGDANMGMSLMPDFNDIDYGDISVEED